MAEKFRADMWQSHIFMLTRKQTTTNLPNNQYPLGLGTEQNHVSVPVSYRSGFFSELKHAKLILFVSLVSGTSGHKGKDEIHSLRM